MSTDINLYFTEKKQKVLISVIDNYKNRRNHYSDRVKLKDSDPLFLSQLISLMVMIFWSNKSICYSLEQMIPIPSSRLLECQQSHQDFSLFEG